MAQAQRLDKIYSENFFREKKANKGFLEYSFQMSSSNYCIMFLG